MHAILCCRLFFVARYSLRVLYSHYMTLLEEVSCIATWRKWRRCLARRVGVMQGEQTLLSSRLPLFYLQYYSIVSTIPHAPYIRDTAYTRQLHARQLYERRIQVSAVSHVQDASHLLSLCHTSCLSCTRHVTRIQYRHTGHYRIGYSQRASAHTSRIASAKRAGACRIACGCVYPLLLTLSDPRV